MPLVRVTPETAAETVEQLTGELRGTIEEAGRSPALLTLRQRTEDLLRVIEARVVEVEILLLDDIHPQWTGSISNWLGMEPDPLVEAIDGESIVALDTQLDKALSVVKISGSGLRTAGQAGTRTAPVFIVAHGSTDSPDEEVLQEIIGEIKRRPLTILLAPKGTDWAQGLAGLGSRESWICKFLPLETLFEKSLEGTLARPPWQQAGQLAASWSVSEALSSVHAAFAVALEREGRVVDTRRAGLEQQASVDQRLTTTASPTELLGEVRGLIQKRFDRFSKASVADMKGLVEPHEGSLRLEIEREIDTLEDFDYEKKPKVFRVTIPSELQNGLLARTREVLEERGHTDVDQMRNLLAATKEDVERLIEERGGPPVALHFHPFEDQAFDKILDRSLVMQRPYKGELTRRGPMDFFMQARRYQMVFFMVASAFVLSFIRSYREVTIPLGMLLLMFGLLNVVNQSKKQAAEAKATELAKARDTLRNDLGRSMADIQKSWTQMVSNHLSEEQTKALELIEGAAKAAAADADRSAAENKDLLNKQLKGLDVSQRNINEGVKRSEAATTDLHMLSQQVVEFYAAMVRPPADAAAVPGVPGAPAVPTAGAVPGRPAIPGVPSGPSGPSVTPAVPPAASAEAAQAMKKLQDLQAKAAKPASGAQAGRSATPARPKTPRPGATRPEPPKAGAPRPGTPPKRDATAKPKIPRAGGAARKPTPKPSGGAGEAQKKLEEMKKKLQSKRAGSAKKSPKPPSSGSR